MPEQEVKIAKLEAELEAMRLQFSELIKRFMRHMDKEEAAFSKLYERMHSIEKELMEAFKERDKLIVDIRLHQTKLLGGMTAAFAIITVGTDFVMRVWF